ncbi:hypothetical protein Taro_040806, partial [Colocasia esculenta]|nr:hypothetical protein [Colocasia esculenta]
STLYLSPSYLLARSHQARRSCSSLRYSSVGARVEGAAAEMGPGLYSDIGKKARDLLYKDYQTDQKISITTYSPNGAAITSSGIKKNDLIIGDIQANLKGKGVTTDLKLSSDSKILPDILFVMIIVKVFATFTVDELAPGFKSIFSFVVPDQRSGKVELQYLHDYAGISASFGLTANPIVNFASVLGTETLAAGVDLSFNTATGNFTKYNAGVNITNSDLIVSVTLNDKADNLTASYYHQVRPLTSTAVGAELTHCFSSNENTLTFGTQHALDPLTTVKGRFNNFGKASALIQHEWRPKSLITISGEVDTKAIEKSSKVGLSLVLKP